MADIPPTWVTELRAWATDLFTTKAGLAIVAAVIGAVTTAYYSAKPVDPMVPLMERAVKALEREPQGPVGEDPALKLVVDLKASNDATTEALLSIAGSMAEIAQPTPKQIQPTEKKAATEPFKFKE